MSPDLGWLWRGKDLGIKLPRRAPGRLGFGQWVEGRWNLGAQCCGMQGGQLRRNNLEKTSWRGQQKTGGLMDRRDPNVGELGSSV